MTAAEVSTYSPPTAALAVLVVVLVASSVTFWLLVQRATSHRRWLELADWARENGFRRDPAALRKPPAPLDAVPDAAVGVQTCLTDGRTTLLELKAGADRPAPAGATGTSCSASWSRRGSPPAPARLTRPPALDLFPLAAFPLLPGSERFVVYGTDPVAARRLANSHARGLLPPNVGLLLHGRHLLLDFSARPFDSIEFGRIARWPSSWSRTSPPRRESRSGASLLAAKKRWRSLAPRTMRDSSIPPPSRRAPYRRAAGSCRRAGYETTDLLSTSRPTSSTGICFTARQTPSTRL